LALMLSGAAFAAPEEIQSISATIASPDPSSGSTSVPSAQTEQANPALTEPGLTEPAPTEQAKPALTDQAKPALSAQDMAVADKLHDMVENKLRQIVTREQDRAGVEAFYRDRGFAPLWVGNNAALPRTKEAIAFLRGVAADGLDPDDYPTPGFADSSPDKLAADELKLTNSVLTFARHASTGRVAFSRVSGSVYFDLKSPAASDTLAKLAAATNVRDALDAFNPQHPAYKALKAQLAAAHQPAAGRTDRVRIPDGPILRPGMSDPRVPILRERLNVAGDNLRYDDETVAAVKRFQEQSELNPDGSVGPNTVAKLNGESRLDQTDTIIANLERWRWLPHDLGAIYVMVNVPDYTLKVVDHGNTVWSTRIVVGKPGKYSTPLLTETMKYITVNPTWNVPPSIIRNEYLPALQQDPGALARIGLRMGRNADGSLRIYQPPGEKNALGRIRFNFPNRFLVYQHDTPDKNLFEKSARAYSHGCMRVQNPDQYAETLLSITQPEDHYTTARIRSLYGSGERTINFKNPIPVYVTYQTAFVDDGGQLQTRADIYGLDKEIASVLHGERRIADVPVARNYSSGSKPVMAQLPSRNADYDGFASDGWGRNSEPSPWQSTRRPFDRFKSW
jgi:murein L,D-transpeptidase YcbB/YkuD